MHGLGAFLLISLAAPAFATPGQVVQVAATGTVTAAGLEASPSDTRTATDPKADDQPAARDAAHDRPDATWVSRMVRPCVRSGDRMVC